MRKLDGTDRESARNFVLSEISSLSNNDNNKLAEMR